MFFSWYPNQNEHLYSRYSVQVTRTAAASSSRKRTFYRKNKLTGLFYQGERRGGGCNLRVRGLHQCSVDGISQGLVSRITREEGMSTRQYVHFVMFFFRRVLFMNFIYSIVVASCLS